MRVKFFKGNERRKAELANTSEVCAVNASGCYLVVNRKKHDLEMTDAVIRAVAERWEQEIPLLKQLPYMMLCSAPVEDGWLHDELHVRFGKGMLDGWKEFLAELLSRPDSWQSHGRETKAHQQARHRALSDHYFYYDEGRIERPKASSKDLLEKIEREIERELADIQEKQRREEKERESRPHVDVGDFSGVVALFRATDGKLRSPEIRLQVGDQGILMYEHSKYPDRLLIVADEHRRLRTWYGSVSSSGRLEMTHSLTRDSEFAAALVTALQRLAANSDAELGHYGRVTGRCTFCGQQLIDARSKAVGFGEICAANRDWKLHKRWINALNQDSQAAAETNSGRAHDPLRPDMAQIAPIR